LFAFQQRGKLFTAFPAGAPTRETRGAQPHRLATCPASLALPCQSTSGYRMVFTAPGFDRAASRR
jgi:hypothetical protein